VRIRILKAVLNCLDNAIISLATSQQILWKWKSYFPLQSEIRITFGPRADQKNHQFHQSNTIPCARHCDVHQNKLGLVSTDYGVCIQYSHPTPHSLNNGKVMEISQYNEIDTGVKETNLVYTFDQNIIIAVLKS